MNIRSFSTEDRIFSDLQEEKDEKMIEVVRRYKRKREMTSKL
jgi:hypothetical protein